MNPVAEFSDSLHGWAEIIAGKREAQAWFRTGWRGVVGAVVAFAVAVLLFVAVQSMAAGMPGLGQVLFGLLAEGATVALVGLAIRQTLRFSRVDVAPNLLFVPIVYALAYAFIVAIPLSLIGSTAGLLAVIAVTGLIFRAGQVLGGMRPGIAGGLAAACFIVLVVVPNGLYMLLSLVSPTA